MGQCSLDYSGLPKGHVSPALRIGTRRPDNYMVEQLDVHRFGRIPQLPRDLNVGRGSPGVARGMIVLCCAPSYVE